MSLYHGINDFDDVMTVIILIGCGVLMAYQLVMMWIEKNAKRKQREQELERRRNRVSIPKWESGYFIQAEARRKRDEADSIYL